MMQLVQGVKPEALLRPAGHFWGCSEEEADIIFRHSNTNFLENEIK